MEIFSISFLKLKLLIPGHEGHSSPETLDPCSCQKLCVVEETPSILFAVFMVFATASGVYFLPVISPCQNFHSRHFFCISVKRADSFFLLGPILFAVVLLLLSCSCCYASCGFLCVHRSSSYINTSLMKSKFGFIMHSDTECFMCVDSNFQMLLQSTIVLEGCRAVLWAKEEPSLTILVPWVGQYKLL